MWDMVTNRRTIFGAKKIKEAADLYEWNGCKKVFVAAYDKNAAVVKEITKDLKGKNINYHIFDEVKGEPDLAVINEGKKIFLEEKCDSMLAIGGGSVIDAAKAIAMLTTNGGLIEEYQMEGRQVTKEAPFYVAIPTTSGTGAEATKVSVIYNNIHGVKKSVYHPSMIADIVILDPEVTVGLPSKLTASTGMDALSHAIESYVSLNANDMSEMYSLKALGLIGKNLVKAVYDGENLEARGGMALGSYFAGYAISAGIGIAHIVAQPLGAVFKIPHGDACSIFLPLAMELNLEHSQQKYRKIAEVLGVNTSGLDDITAGQLGIKKVKEIREQIGAPARLSPYMNGQEINMPMVLENIKNSTGHIKCNPRVIDENLLTEIIQKSI